MNAIDSIDRLAARARRNLDRSERMAQHMVTHRHTCDECREIVESMLIEMTIANAIDDEVNKGTDARSGKA